jgi:hypothetical protein
MNSKIKERLMGFAAIEFNPAKTLVRYFITLLVGAMITLSVCPQFGVGPIGGGHGIVHVVMSYGPVVCASFCAVFLFSISTLLAMLVLNSSQRQWLTRQALGVSLASLAALFFVLMLAKFASGAENIHETWSFYLTWPIIGTVTCWTILRTIRELKLT